MLATGIIGLPNVGKSTLFNALTAGHAHVDSYPFTTIDSNLGTRWSANGTGQWIRWDLGSPQTLSEIRLAWFRGAQRTATFDIQVSDDGSTWTTILASATSSGTTLDLQAYPLPETTTRYVRYLGYGNSDGNGWNSITEVALLYSDESVIDDGDSLPDPWEWARLGTTDYGPGDDPMGKGFSLEEEFLAGTDPMDPTDRLNPVISTSANPGQIRVAFPARAAFGPGYDNTERRYTLWHSSDMTPGSWEIVPGYASIKGRNLPVDAEINHNPSHSFFRITYELIVP